ncbi:MAG: thioredoxin [Bacteroidales bacterium]|nr:thioredoxin [Bacteroidales bacterium]
MAYYWYIIIIIVAALAFFMIRRYRMFMSGVDTPDSEKLLRFTDKNFSHQIKNGIVLIDFWAEWCQPCKIQGPIVSQLAEDNTDKNVKIGKLNVEKSPKAAQKLGIKNIPTIIIFKSGKEAKRMIGLKNKKVLEKAILELK